MRSPSPSNQSSRSIPIIISSVSSSILEVVLLCLAGYILSSKGIIDSRSKNTLNKINVSFFTPALMFSKVAFSLTSEKLVDLWIVPLSFIIISLTSLLVGWCSSQAFRLPRSQRNFCLSFSMFMNSNSLPIALMTSLITTFQDPHGLKWGDDDSRDKQLGRSLSYLIVFSTLGLISRWSYGVNLLSASVGNDRRRMLSFDEQSDEGIEDGFRSSNPETVPFLRSNSIDELTSPQSGLEETHPVAPPRTHPNPRDQATFESDHDPSRSDFDASSDQLSKDPPVSSSPLTPTPASLSQAHGRLLRPIFHSFPNVREYWSHSISSKRNSLSTSYTISTVASGIESIESDPQSEDHTIFAHSVIPDPRLRLPSPRPFSQQITRTVHLLMKRIKKLVRWLIVRPMLRINQFMSPPLYSAFLSLVVVCLPSLQSRLEKISPLKSALKSAGNVSVPLTLVVLGAYFHNTHDQSIHSSKSNDLTRDTAGPSRSVTQKSSRSKKTERLTIVASILSRMIITPLILVPLLFIVLRYFHRPANDDDPGSGSPAGFHEDPCFILVTVLLIGAPPAITLAQMTSSNPYPIGSEAYQLQASQNSKFEKLVSRTLLISYAIITPPTTIALVVLGLLIEANR